MVTITTGLESSGERNIECPCGRFEKKREENADIRKANILHGGWRKSEMFYLLERRKGK